MPQQEHLVSNGPPLLGHAGLARAEQAPAAAGGSLARPLALRGPGARGDTEPCPGSCCPSTGWAVPSGCCRERPRGTAARPAWLEKCHPPRQLPGSGWARGRAVHERPWLLSTHRCPSSTESPNSGKKDTSVCSRRPWYCDSPWRPPSLPTSSFPSHCWSTGVEPAGVPQRSPREGGSWEGGNAAGIPWPAHTGCQDHEEPPQQRPL